MLKYRYVVKDPKARGGKSAILIESSRTGGRHIARAGAKPKQAAEQLEKELGPLSAVANSVLQAFSAVQPGKVEIKFGVELGGELGIPMVTSGYAKANFTVTLTWEKAKA